MLRDGTRRGVFEAMGRIHPRYRAPTVAIIAQAIWSGVLVLSGSLSQLVSYTGFAIVLFSGIAVSAFRPASPPPEQERPFRAWGYPWAPGLFIAASAAMVTNELWRNPLTSMAGVALIAAGIPLYWLRTTKR
jgi:APA family basic amino acid/polyamine antiporter